MKYIKRIYYIVILSLVWIWYHVIWRRKRVRVEPFDADFFKEMETAAENRRIGLDVKTGIFFMTTPFYNEYLCDGAMSMLNDPKAHLFFRKLRQWINIHRGVYNGETDSELQTIEGDEEINFGVLDAENNIYIVGKERPNLLFVSFNNKDNNEITNTNSDEGNTQEQDA